MHNPKPFFLSVVIPTKNSKAFLEIVLPSIFTQQSECAFEVIIADNHSTDDTVKYSQSLGCKIVQVDGPAPQGCKQRNEGIKNASGTYVLVLDHDMELAQNFLSDLKLDIDKNDAVLAWYIPEKVVCETQLLTSIRNFENKMFAETPIAATRLFHTSVFELIGFYDEDLSNGPGDWDFDMKVHHAGLSTRSINSYVIHHEEKLTLDKYVGKKYGYVAGSIKYKTKWQKAQMMKDRLNKQFSIVYRVFGFINSRDKLMYAIQNPLLYIMFLIVTFAKAIQYIRHKLSL